MPKDRNSKYRKFDIEGDSLNFKFEYNGEETKALQNKLNGSSKIEICDLYRIALWKNSRVLDVSDDTIRKLNQLAKMEDAHIDHPDIKELINDLVNSQGIWFPLASAILKFVRPDIFPIIDIRAYRALTGKTANRSTYNLDRYIEYTKELMSIAKAKKLQLSDVDEQLYCYDKSPEI